VGTNGHPLDALGDPTRRQVFELLRSGPRSVGELAADLPVSRPAVSQHLRVLEEAGLVVHEKQGTRHLYELDSSGVRALRDWVDGFWDEALARFRAAAESKGGTT
jgi:DNA-binding transcriptional ArsR family regulator